MFLSCPGQLYGLEKFWAFLKYSKIKNQPIDPKLQEHLSKFRNLEDFRVVVSVSKELLCCFNNQNRSWGISNCYQVHSINGAAHFLCEQEGERELLIGWIPQIRSKDP